MVASTNLARSRRRLGDPVRAHLHAGAVPPAAVTVAPDGWRAQLWSRAAGVLEDFRDRYPEHELASQVTANLAVAYVESGDSTRAAGMPQLSS